MAESDDSRLYNEGREHLESGRLDLAVDCLHRSAAIEPHFKTLELLGEAYLRQGRPKEAIIPLAAATTLNRQVRAPSMLAEALLAVGDELHAHAVAALAIERDSNNKRARAVLEETEAAYQRWAGDGS